MGRKNKNRLGVKLSWLLRHGASAEGLPVDDAGWVSIEGVLRTLQMSRAKLDEITADNNKNRYEQRGELIRASQGHSLDMPVTLDALEASWTRYEGSDRVWHGTHLAALVGIASEGISSAKRTHVHLAVALDSEVGKRHRVGVMLGVSVARLRASGAEVFISPNGVVLTRHVPVACIDACELMTSKAKAAGASLRADFPELWR